MALNLGRKFEAPRFKGMCNFGLWKGRVKEFFGSTMFTGHAM